MNEHLKGTVYGVISAVSYGMNPLFALFLYQEGLRVESVLFYRYLLAAMLLGVLMKIRRESFALKQRELFPLLMLGVLFATASLSLFSSFHYMDAGIASTILFVYPVMVAVIMAVCFKERVSLVTTGSILLSILGIALLYQGGGGTTLSITGISLVILSSLSYAVYMIVVHKSIVKDMPSFKLTFYVLLGCLAVVFVYSRFGTTLQPMPSVYAWFIVAGLALVPTVISLVTMALSIHHIGSTSTAILGALEPVTALCIGVMVFGEQLTPRILCGVLLVILAVLLIILARPLSKTLKHVLVRHRIFSGHSD